MTTTWLNTPTVYSTPKPHPTLCPSPLLPPWVFLTKTTAQTTPLTTPSPLHHPPSILMHPNSISTGRSTNTSSSLTTEYLFHALLLQEIQLHLKTVLLPRTFWPYCQERSTSMCMVKKRTLRSPPSALAPCPLMLSFCLIPIQVFSSSLTLEPADPSFRSPRYTAAALPAPTQTSLLPMVHIS